MIPIKLPYLVVCQVAYWYNWDLYTFFFLGGGWGVIFLEVRNKQIFPLFSLSTFIPPHSLAFWPLDMHVCCCWQCKPFSLVQLYSQICQMFQGQLALQSTERETPSEWVGRPCVSKHWKRGGKFWLCRLMKFAIRDDTCQANIKTFLSLATGGPRGILKANGKDSKGKKTGTNGFVLWALLEMLLFSQRTLFRAVL